MVQPLACPCPNRWKLLAISAVPGPRLIPPRRTGAAGPSSSASSRNTWPAWCRELAVMTERLRRGDGSARAARVTALWGVRLMLPTTALYPKTLVTATSCIGRLVATHTGSRRSCSAADLFRAARLRRTRCLGECWPYFWPEGEVLPR